MKTNIHFWSYLARLFLEWKIFQTNVVEKIKTHISYLIILLFFKSCGMWDNVEECCRAGQVTDYNMAHSQFNAEYLRLQVHTKNL